MAYNTGNPVPSTDAKDFIDNCENLDKFANLLESTATDRNGVTRSTYEGVVQGLSFFNVGTFAVGFTLTNSRQTLTYNGHEYGWSGVFPKVVNAGSTPTPLGSGGWIDRSDVTLRGDISSITGMSMIGSSDGFTAQDEIDFLNESTDGALTAIDHNGAVIIIGDSITNGASATDYTHSFPYMLCRSIFNHVAGVGASDKGYGYETVMRMATAVTYPGISRTGTLITDTGVGAVESRLRLNSGQYIQVTGREARTIDIFYDGVTSSGNITFTVNGVLLTTKAVDNSTGTKSTFPTTPSSVGSYGPDDVIQIAASGGTVYVTGLVSIGQSNRSPYVTIAARGSWGLDEFADDTRASEVAAQVNTFRSAASKTLIICLGTNNMYNPSLQKSPAQYVSALANLIAVYKSKMTIITPVISVPPQANESIFPITSGYSYSDFVKAIVEFAKSNDYQLIRFDKTNLDASYYSDGIHPRDAGHSIMAAKVCETMSIPYSIGEFRSATWQDSYRDSQISYNSTWGNFASLASFQVEAHKIGGLIHLSGACQPNGSTSTTIGYLSVGFRPRGMDVFCTCNAGHAPAVVRILQTTGEVRVETASLSASFVSLQGVSFLIKPI